MPNKSESVEIQILKETPSAILADDGDTQCWLPKSQIEYDEPDEDGNTTVNLPEWLAIEKELV